MRLHPPQHESCDKIRQSGSTLIGIVQDMTSCYQRIKRAALIVPVLEELVPLVTNFCERDHVVLDFDVTLLDLANTESTTSFLRHLCIRHGWSHRRFAHSDAMARQIAEHNYSLYNRAVFEALTRVGRRYPYVVKAECEACILSDEWREEFSTLDTPGAKLMGTPELRSTNDSLAFWNLARKHGCDFELSEWIVHMQGGFYGLNREACEALNGLGFLGGRHHGFKDDCYVSYCCMLKRAQLIRSTTVGCWRSETRPPLETIAERSVIFPLSYPEWLSFQDRLNGAQINGSDYSTPPFLCSRPLIPKVCYFIWLGSPVPSIAHENIAAFKDLHRDWRTVLISHVPVDMPADLLEMIWRAPKMVMKADLIRLWLIYQHGGVYLDTDVRVLRNIDDLIHLDHFASWEHGGAVNNAILGGTKANAVFESLLNAARDLVQENGFPLWFLSYGPDLLTRYYNEKRHFNVLPVHHFCIFHGHNAAHNWVHRDGTTKRERFLLDPALYADGTTPYGLHLWGIPTDQMTSDLPQSSVVDSNDLSDAVLQRFFGVKSSGLVIFSEQSRVVEYLRGMDASMEVIGVNLRDAGNGADSGCLRLDWIAIDVKQLAESSDLRVAKRLITETSARVVIGWGESPLFQQLRSQLASHQRAAEEVVQQGPISSFSVHRKEQRKRASRSRSGHRVSHIRPTVAS